MWKVFEYFLDMVIHKLNINCKAYLHFFSQGQYVSFLFLCLTWGGWMIYKHYINSHVKLQDHICLILIGQNPTYESGFQDQNHHVAWLFR